MFAKKEISKFFIEMFYLKLPLPYYNKRINKSGKNKKKQQENTAYHNVLIVQSWQPSHQNVWLTLIHSLNTPNHLFRSTCM